LNSGVYRLLVLLFLLTTWNCFLRDRPSQYQAVRAAGGTSVAGSSLATSTALAIALAEHAIPVTDSDAHFRLLSLRMARAATAASRAPLIPGLRAQPNPARGQKTALVERRIVDSVVSHEDLAALSLEDCLRYRERTTEERAQFREFLHDVVNTVQAEPWSPEVVPQIEERLTAARQEIRDHVGALRDTYRSLFHRTLAGLAVTAAPALLATVFPVVSPLTVLLFGGGPLTAVLQEPVRELLAHWWNRDRGTSSLSYLMDLPVR
jgi:signal transduction histidine kinase